jgi:uncharacterized OB-fold protein
VNPYGKPVPVPDPVSEPFWRALHGGRFLLQRCGTCERRQFYPRAACSHCGAMDLEWAPATGRGEVYSYTVIHRSGVPGWSDEVPYVVAIVELDEGPRMQSNIVGCEPSEVTVGARVRLSPTPVTDSVSLPLFVLER